MRRLRAFAALAALSGFPRAAWAQVDPHVAQPERPTVSTPASTVAPGWVEVEGGLEVDNYTNHSRGDIGPIAVKIGLAPRWQLTLQEAVIRAPGAQVTGLGDVAAALKWRVAEERPVVGDLAILTTLKVPTGSIENGDGTGTTDLSMTLIASRGLGPVAVDLNYGVTRRSGNGDVAPRHASLWAAAASGPVHRSVGWMSEVFGFPATTGTSGSGASVGLIEGVTLQVRKWLVLDAGVAIPVRGPQPHALFTGLTCNIGSLDHVLSRSGVAVHDYHWKP